MMSIPLLFDENNCRNPCESRHLKEFRRTEVCRTGRQNRNAGRVDERKRSDGSRDRYRDRGIRGVTRLKTRKTPKTPKTLEALETLRYPPRPANSNR